MTNWPTDRLPSGVSDRLGLFDRFASGVGRLVSRAPFFAAAVTIVVAWLIEGAVKMAASGPRAFLDQTYQLQITPDQHGHHRHHVPAGGPSAEHPGS